MTSYFEQNLEYNTESTDSTNSNHILHMMLPHKFTCALKVIYQETN